jgi:Uma2 family endonuclease
MIVSYEILETPERWVLPEGKVPESALHDRSIDLARRQLDAWIERTGRNAIVYRDIAVRWVKKLPRTGFNPDLCLVEPTPSERDELDSLLLWQPSRVAPRLALEVVSKNHPYKDYGETPDKCAAAGIPEVIAFDPHLAGPRIGGGPHFLQVWRMTGDRMQRIYAGPGPVWCATLDAWIHVVENGKRIRFADDEAGQAIWPTDAEAERAEASRQREEASRQREEASRQREEADRLRAEAQAARARIEELEARLKKG